MQRALAGNFRTNSAAAKVQIWLARAAAVRVAAALGAARIGTALIVPPGDRIMLATAIGRA
jgi:hypothetical protein